MSTVIEYNAEEIEKIPYTKLEDFFNGRVPGISAMDGGDYLNYIFIRGMANFSRFNSAPKIYVDGVELLTGMTVIWGADEDDLVRNKIYEVAIEEGSTMVRVGTAIFGERTY